MCREARGSPKSSPWDEAVGRRRCRRRGGLQPSLPRAAPSRLESLFADASPGFFDLGAAALPLDELSFFSWGTRSFLSSCLGRIGPELAASLCPSLRKFIGKPFPRDPAIHALAARIGDRHRDPCGKMRQGDGGGDLVDMLTARSGGSGKAFRQIFFTKFRNTHVMELLIVRGLSLSPRSFGLSI